MFPTAGFAGKSSAKLREVLGLLRDAYCRTVGVEYMHLQDPRQRRWLQERLEAGYARTPARSSCASCAGSTRPRRSRRSCRPSTSGRSGSRSRAASRSSRCWTRSCPAPRTAGWTRSAIGMAHRGRLNVLANLAGKSVLADLQRVRGQTDPRSVQGSGDVKYHLGTEGVFTAESGATTQVYLAANPSHLEAVDPVLEGIVRAKQDRIRPRRRRVLGAADPDPRRRGVRRAGRGLRDAQPGPAARLPHRRHRARDRQQPGRLHHRPASSRSTHVLHRRRQGLPGADLPRQRRRPRGVRARRASSPSSSARSSAAT